MRPADVFRCAAVVTTLLWSAPTLAQNGVLGIYFDDRGNDCAAAVGPGASRTLWVIFGPQGSTRGGITGAEFRIDISEASGFSFGSSAATLPGALVLGNPLQNGVNVASGECQSDLALSILRFEVVGTGSATDAVVRIAPRIPPSNATFPCPLAVLCDAPTYTAVCVESGRAVLNPTRSVNCGSSAESAEWSRVKELYR